MLGNKILPIFALIINIGLAGFIFKSWTTAQRIFETLFANGSINTLLIIAVILFALFIYLGIPIIIFYSEDDSIKNSYRLMDSIITIFAFVLITYIAPILIKIIFALLDAIAGMGVNTTAGVIMAWLLIIILLIVAPIFVFFAKPTERILDKVESNVI
jgi:hypothetical protein